MVHRERALEDLVTPAVPGTNHELWPGRRVLVTGAAGFIGSRLVERLLRLGAEVTALDVAARSPLDESGLSDRLRVVRGSVDPVALARTMTDHGTQTVFHLAAQAIVATARANPVATFETNIRGTWTLLDTCRQRGDAVSEVVVASSDKAYGNSDRLPYTEEMPLAGRQPYEVSKACADLLAQCYHHAFGLRVAVARCGNVYGGGDLNWSRLIPGTIAALERGRRPVVRSDGSHIRDYIYVEDVVGAYVRLAEALRAGSTGGEAFNFSTESRSTVLDVVDKLRSLMGCEHLEPDVRATAEGEIPAQYLSAEKARSVLGWSPRYDLDSGLPPTIEWYRTHLQRDSVRSA